MAQTSVTFRIDEELKAGFEKTCEELGMSMTTALTIFAKKVNREKLIPFDVSIDKFYSESNIKYLEEIKRDADEGKVHFAEHELIED